MSKPVTTSDAEQIRQFVREPCDERYRSFFMRIADRLETLDGVCQDLERISNELTEMQFNPWKKAFEDLSSKIKERTNAR